MAWHWYHSIIMYVYYVHVQLCSTIYKSIIPRTITNHWNHFAGTVWNHVEHAWYHTAAALFQKKIGMQQKSLPFPFMTFWNPTLSICPRLLLWWCLIRNTTATQHVIMEMISVRTKLPAMTPPINTLLNCVSSASVSAGDVSAGDVSSSPGNVPLWASIGKKKWICTVNGCLYLRRRSLISKIEPFLWILCSSGTNVSLFPILYWSARYSELLNSSGCIFWLLIFIANASPNSICIRCLTFLRQQTLYKPSEHLSFIGLTLIIAWFRGDKNRSWNRVVLSFSLILFLLAW